MSFFRRRKISNKDKALQDGWGQAAHYEDISVSNTPPSISNKNSNASNYSSNTTTGTNNKTTTNITNKYAVTWVSQGAAKYLVDKKTGVVFQGLDDFTKIGSWTFEHGVLLDSQQGRLLGSSTSHNTTTTTHGTTTYNNNNNNNNYNNNNNSNNNNNTTTTVPHYTPTSEDVAFANPLIELETSIVPRSVGVFEPDATDAQGKTGYQGTNPDWIDSQHGLMADKPWFYDKGTITANGAVRQLISGAQGQFLVRIVHGKELRELPSKFHCGQPGNYAISIKMNKKVFHLLVLPSWDPTRQAEGETLYRVGTKNKKFLFNSVPELIDYYSKKKIYKDPVSGKKFRLIHIMEGVTGYQDIDGAMVDAKGYNTSSSTSASAGLYDDLPPSVQPAYMDVSVPEEGQSFGGFDAMKLESDPQRAGYMTMAPDPSLTPILTTPQTGYVLVAPQANHHQQQQHQQQQQQQQPQLQSQQHQQQQQQQQFQQHRSSQQQQLLLQQQQQPQQQPFQQQQHKPIQQQQQQQQPQQPQFQQQQQQPQQFQQHQQQQQQQPQQQQQQPQQFQQHQQPQRQQQQQQQPQQQQQQQPQQQQQQQHIATTTTAPIGNTTDFTSENEGFEQPVLDDFDC